MRITTSLRITIMAKAQAPAVGIAPVRRIMHIRRAIVAVARLRVEEALARRSAAPRQQPRRQNLAATAPQVPARIPIHLQLLRRLPDQIPPTAARAFPVV